MTVNVVNADRIPPVWLTSVMRMSVLVPWLIFFITLFPVSQTYSDCACANGTATAGFCASEDPKVYVLLMYFTLTSFAITFTASPTFMIFVRCVPWCWDLAQNSDTGVSQLWALKPKCTCICQTETLGWKSGNTSRVAKAQRLFFNSTSRIMYCLLGPLRQPFRCSLLCHLG